MKIKIGEKLQAIREDRKMSQAEFAEILSMSQSAYSRLERGETQLSFEEITRMSETLNVPINELLPEIGVFYQTNNGKGSGVIFGSYVENIGASEKIKELEEETRILTLKNEHLQEKITLLEKQIEIMGKK